MTDQDIHKLKDVYTDIFAIEDCSTYQDAIDAVKMVYPDADEALIREAFLEHWLDSDLCTHFGLQPHTMPKETGNYQKEFFSRVELKEACREAYYKFCPFDNKEESFEYWFKEQGF